MIFECFLNSIAFLQNELNAFVFVCGMTFDHLSSDLIEVICPVLLFLR